MSYPKTKLMNLEDGQTLLGAIDGKMFDLKSAFKKVCIKQKNVDFTSETVISGAITTGNKWSTSSGFSSYIFSIDASYYKLSMTAGNNNAILGLLKNNNLISQETPPFCDGTERIVVSPGETMEIAIPSDCNYIVVTKNVSASDDRTPSNMDFYLYKNIPAVDNTLSVQNAAADAKATGDEINIIKNALLATSQPEYGEGYSVFIDGSDKWAASSSPNSKIIPIPEGALQINVTANNIYNAVIAFLKTNDHVPGTLVNYAEGTGRIIINAGAAQSFSVPDDASYLYVLNKFNAEIRLPESVLITYFVKAEDTQRLAKANEQVLGMITKTNTITAGTLSVENKYIDVGNARIGSAAAASARLLIIPSGNFSAIRISIPLASTKRIAFCESLDLSAPVYNVAEIVGSLDGIYKTNGHAYCVVQLFTDNDAEQDYEAYLTDAVIESIEAPDYYARNEISKITDRRFFHAENLLGLPILSSFSDIGIVTSAFNDSAAFHALVGTLCEGSNGYITQTLIGNDGHGNNLYKYETVPKSLKYGVARRDGAPIIPVQGGKTIGGLTCLITSNIHGREKNGNWVVYNLLAKVLNGDSDMLRFIRNRVKIVWVPFICASGDYENADGININRDFPTTIDGTCTSPEATAVKNVIDEYGDQLFLHIDIHTFNASASYADAVSGWIFTDSEKFAERTVISATDVMNQYHAKYPSINRFGLDFIGSTNIATTCTYYTQTVYGVPSATIEGVLTMGGSPEGSDAHTSAVAYLYDVITHALCSMVG